MNIVRSSLFSSWIDRCRSAAGQARDADGQVLVLFAFSMIAMMGMLGLATDAGYAYAQRRAMQNAADAAAEAGARIVAKAAYDSSLSAQSDVQALAAANAGGAATTVSCTYVNDAGTSLGDCGNTVPSTATGVNVTVKETHNTFFIKVVPGAPKTVTTGATAQGNVQLMSTPPSDGPFIVCGVGSTTTKGANVNILQQSNGHWELNPSANDQTFVIHGPQIADCNTQANRFKGLADQAANAGLTPPAWFHYDTGTVAGPTRTQVNGIQGCKQGQAADDCVLILPVGVNTPAESGNAKEVYVVAYAAFMVSQTSANTHSGTLLLDYIPLGSGSSGWTRTTPGPVVVRVTK